MGLPADFRYELNIELFTQFRKDHEEVVPMIKISKVGKTNFTMKGPEALME
jgi:hypothetical protein